MLLTRPTGGAMVLLVPGCCPTCAPLTGDGLLAVQAAFTDHTDGMAGHAWSPVKQFLHTGGIVWPSSKACQRTTNARARTFGYRAPSDPAEPRPSCRTLPSSFRAESRNPSLSVLCLGKDGFLDRLGMTEGWALGMMKTSTSSPGRSRGIRCRRSDRRRPAESRR